MYLFNGSGTSPSSFSVLFLPTFFKVIIFQVAVKSLLVYASDPLMEKKTKVSIFDRTLQVSFMPDIAVCRGYNVNSEHVQDSSIQISYLYMVTHVVFPRSWPSSAPGQRTEI
jgi:hypothetical protein